MLVVKLYCTLNCKSLRVCLPRPRTSSTKRMNLTLLRASSKAPAQTVALGQYPIMVCSSHVCLFLPCPSLVVQTCSSDGFLDIHQTRPCPQASSTSSSCILSFANCSSSSEMMVLSVPRCLDQEVRVVLAISSSMWRRAMTCALISTPAFSKWQVFDHRCQPPREL